MQIAHVYQRFTSSYHICLVDEALKQWVANGAQDTYSCNFGGSQELIAAGTVRAVEIQSELATGVELAFFCLALAILAGVLFALCKMMIKIIRDR